MSDEYEPSALPPLDPKKSTSSNDEIDISPQEIKRAILQLYPRIQSIEKKLKDIQSQLPSELNKSILQIRRDISTLREKYGTQIDISDVISHIVEVENRLNLNIDLCVDESVSNFNKNILQYYKPEEASNDNTLEDFNKRINSFEELMNQQNKHKEQRLSNLERKIAKLTSHPPSQSSSEQIEKPSKTMKSQNLQLAELKSKINKISIPSDQNNVFSVTQPISTTTSSLSTTTTLSSPSTKNSIVKPKQIKDNTIPLQNLTDLVQNFRNDFTNSLTEARQKTQDCKNRIIEVKNMTNEIKESASDIESRVIEVNNLCDSLSKQISGINQKLLHNDAQKAIESITMQIKSAQDNIMMELNSIKSRLKKCEMSEPLIETTFSNVDSNSNKEPNLAIVTVGETADIEN